MDFGRILEVDLSAQLRKFYILQLLLIALVRFLGFKVKPL